MPEIKAWTYYGETVRALEALIQNLIDRGGIVQSVGIGYGPALRENSWQALVIVDISGIDPDA
jgi:hypothetical protein